MGGQTRRERHLPTHLIRICPQPPKKCMPRRKDAPGAGRGCRVPALPGELRGGTLWGREGRLRPPPHTPPRPPLPPPPQPGLRCIPRPDPVGARGWGAWGCRVGKGIWAWGGDGGGGVGGEKLQSWGGGEFLRRGAMHRSPVCPPPTRCCGSDGW